MSSLPKIHRSLSEPILNRYYNHTILQYSIIHNHHAFRTNLQNEDLFSNNCSSPKTPVNANLSSFTFASHVWWSSSFPRTSSRDSEENTERCTRGCWGGVRCAASQLRTFQRHVIIRSGVLFIFIRHKVLAKYSSNNNLSSIQKLYLAPAYDYISAIICCSSP